jgi:hypothetical protein
MKFNQKLAQRLFLCLTPLVTGSVFATLPGFAATLATSEATVNFSNFSHNPLTVETEIIPNSPQITNDGRVITESKANASFLVDSTRPAATTAISSSISTVQGDGNGYSGTAQSSARLVGYNFQVTAGETFSLDFTGSLKLNTSIDSDSETANAFGNIVFQLLDSNNLNNPVAFFTISSGLDSLNNSDFLLEPFTSSNVTLLPNQTSSETSFGGNKESANASFTGRVSMFFANTTNLVLRQFSSNSAGASCPAR